VRVRRLSKPLSAVTAVVIAITSATTVASAVRPATVADAAATVSASTASAAMSGYGKLPVAFRPNRGQLGATVRFSAALGAGGLFLTDSGATLSLPSSGRVVAATGTLETRSGTSDPGLGRLGLPSTAARTLRLPATTTAVQLVLAGSSRTGQVTGLTQLPGTANYLIGSDPAQWKLNVPGYATVQYSKAYPGIDVMYRATGTNLEYDFIVAPGASTGRIVMAFAGASSVVKLASGDLAIALGGGRLIQKAPKAYQVFGTTRRAVAAAYLSKGGGKFGLQLGVYDHSRRLVIDPVLQYSTYLGAAGFDAAYAVAVDPAGNAYVAGLTTSTTFPGTVGTTGTHARAFVSKLNPAGNALLYSTYIGGGGDDEALGIALDGSGSAYITGATTSADFPVVGGAYPTYGGGVDSFIAKLNPSGTGLSYSSYLGGTSYDIGYGLAVDPAQNAYVTGVTASGDFPVVGGLGLSPGAGHAHAFVTKFSTGGGIGYSTLLGGSLDDGGAAITVDWTGNAYVTGITTSADFPLAGAFQSLPGGSGDAFVTKLNPTGSGVVFSTFLGGAAFDEGLAVTLDQMDNVFVAGVTTSANFPLTAAWQKTNRGGADAFVTKIWSTGVGIAYSTYIGGSGTDVGFAIGVDWSGNAYVAGVTSSADFPNVYGSQPLKGSSDAFLSLITPAGAVVVLSTLLGGTGDDQIRAIYVDSAGNAYIAGATTSSDFPTQGAFQSALGGWADAFVAKKPPVIPASWWTTYLADTSHTGVNPTQQLLNRGTASKLRPLWVDKVGGFITTQSIIGNGLIYFGSWDGYERAVDPSGRVVWSTYLGVTTNNNYGCLGGDVGVANIGTLITVGSGSVLYVGGGDAAMYALDAMTGAVLWKTSLGTPPAQFLWASPVFSNGSVYEGVGSFQECPAVQGQLVQMDAATGAIQHVWKAVPDGCTGAPVLTTVAVDPTDGSIFIATGSSPNTCAGPYDVAIIKLRASDLSLLDSWQIPLAEQVIDDPDFGASPMLFNATISGVKRDLLGILNKNGTFFALDRHNLSAGPVWRATNIGVPGNCPVCGPGAPISPSAYDGTAIYVGSNQTTIRGATCEGSVRALNPATGAFLWEKCLAAPVLGAITVSQGVAVAGAGPDIFVMSTADGSTLFTYHDPNPAPAPLTGTARFWAGPTIGQGVIYLGNIDGNLFALSL